MINENNLDPDWEFASRHGKASIIGKDSVENTSTMQTVICPCCYQHVYKDPVSLCVSAKQLQFLGFGFPLFYSFIKNCMILIVILISSYNVIALKKAYDANYSICQSSAIHRRLQSSSYGVVCSSFMVQLSRTQQKISDQQQILRLTSFVVQLFFLVYMRDHLTKLEHYYDERNTSLSDYSVLIKNIPKQQKIQTKLREFFRKAFSSPHEIKQITLIPEYPQIDQLLKEREKIVNALRASVGKIVQEQEDIKSKQALKNIDKAFLQQVNISKQLAQKDQLQCEKVILVFNSDEQKTTIIDEFSQIDVSVKGPFLGVDSEEILIKQAPQPKQILWENINTSKEKKFLLIILGWGLAFLLLAIATVSFYFIMEAKSLNLLAALEDLQSHHYQQKYYAAYNQAVAIVYIMLLLVIVFNKTVMASFFHKFTQLEKHQTRSKFQFHFCLKYLVGLFFTTALMTLAVEAIRFKNFYSHPYGVVQQETIMFFLNAFFTPLFWLINPFYIGKRIKKWWKYGSRSMTQKEANELMQLNHYNIGKRLAQISQILWFSFLYSTLIPIGAIISLIGLFLYYWVDKYNLLKRSSLGGEVSGKLIIKGLKLVDFTLVLKPIGELLFDMKARGLYPNISSIVMVVIGGLYLILPIHRILGVLNHQMFDLEQKSYDEIKHLFKDNYHTLHPIYKIIHSQKIKGKTFKNGYTFNQTVNTTQNLVDYSVDEDRQFPTSPGKRIQTDIQDPNEKIGQFSLERKVSIIQSPKRKQHFPHE